MLLPMERRATSVSGPSSEPSARTSWPKLFMSTSDAPIATAMAKKRSQKSCGGELERAEGGLGAQTQRHVASEA